MKKRLLKTYYLHVSGRLNKLFFEEELKKKMEGEKLGEILRKKRKNQEYTS
jgi:hypothetical protein